MLLTVKRRVAVAIVQDMSLEAFIASQPTADLDGKWGKGILRPEQFLKIVYTDLSR